jgi:hypothetical protein
MQVPSNASHHSLLLGEMKSVRHYSLTRHGPLALQIFAIGPSRMNYVNPADHPRKR